MGVLLYKVYPAFSQLKAETVAKAHQDELMDKLLVNRMRRLFGSSGKQTTVFGASLLDRSQKLFQETMKRLRTMEYRLDRQSLARRGAENKEETTEHELQRLLDEAVEFGTQGRYEEAERKYIAAIALDTKSVEAYKGLGNLYYDQKKYDESKATFEHIVKLNERNAEAHARLGAIATATGNLAEAEDDYKRALEMSGDLASAHVDLGYVHQAMEKHEESLENFMRARELEPKNPRVLDLLLENAILLKSRTLAEDVLDNLAEVNPENQKIEEFRSRIAELPVEEVKKKRTRKKV